MKTYLGDGVYVGWTENGIALTTEDGISITNIVYLEGEVIDALVEFLKRQK